MIRTIWSFIEREVRGMHDAAYLLGFFALLSAVLALVRDRLFASAFGAGEMLDVYFAAFRVPDFLFVTIASMVSVFALVPLLESQKSEYDARKVFGNVLLVFALALSGVALLLLPFVPFIVHVLFPNLSTGSFGNEFIAISQIMLLQPIFLGISTVLTSVVQIKGRYVLYALAPLLYNISIIAGVLWAYPIWGLHGLASSVVVGALLHLLIQIPFIVRSGFVAKFFAPIDWQMIYVLIATSLPRTAALASTNILLLILVVLAAGYPEGSVSVFTLAFHLQAAPLGIIGASYSVAAFPTLARHFASGENEAFAQQILTAARHIIFWSLPFLGLFIVLRAHIVRVILGAGAFDWTDTRLVAAAVALFMFALAAQGISLLFIRGYYAAGKTFFPLVISVGSALCTVGLALYTAHVFETSMLFKNTIEILLRVENVSGTVVLMLPLSFAIGALLQAGLFLLFFEMHFTSVRASISRVLFDMTGATVVAAFAAQQTLQLFAPVVSLDRTLGVFAQGFIAGLVGIVAGIVVLLLLKNKELTEVWSTLHHRFWKTNILQPNKIER